ncbi:hypothetical protein AB205_0032450 [Aquarana catesbeiana]|uniref:Uncharacterized protein n=1 Tax=Aquarana catesbeiana TaxID=8400 RepID=A0A2G9SH85_AQUCT|nr:hypothetical protein AB205_0032450 [Aquarana catesbeiana]
MTKNIQCPKKYNSIKHNSCCITSDDLTLPTKCNIVYTIQR